MTTYPGYHCLSDPEICKKNDLKNEGNSALSVLISFVVYLLVDDILVFPVLHWHLDVLIVNSE